VNPPPPAWYSKGIIILRRLHVAVVVHLPKQREVSGREGGSGKRRQDDRVGGRKKMKREARGDPCDVCVIRYITHTHTHTHTHTYTHTHTHHTYLGRSWPRNKRDAGDVDVHLTALLVLLLNPLRHQVHQPVCVYMYCVCIACVCLCSGLCVCLSLSHTHTERGVCVRERVCVRE